MRQRRGTTAIAGLAATLVAASLLSGLSGCSAAPRKPIPLTVAVFQQRTDYAIRGAQIEVTNPSSLDVQVTSATFASSWFTATMSSPSTPTTLRSKSTTDLRLLLAAPVCTADRATPVVQLRYTRPDGSHGEAMVTPTIPFDSISLVHTQDCAQLDFEKVARITIAPTLRFDPAVASDGTRAALIDVTFTPTGASGSVTLHSTEDTTLLAQREGAIRRIELSLTAASPPTTITLDYTPVGCALKHRLAEDKVGTLIPLRVDAGEYHDALFSVPVSAAMKAALMNWIGVYCGW